MITLSYTLHMWITKRDWLRRQPGWSKLDIKRNCLAIMIAIHCLCWQALNQCRFSRTDWTNIYQKWCRWSNPASEIRDLGWKLNFLILFLYLLPQKIIVLLVCSTHFQENQNSFIQASVLQIATSPQIQCDLPLYPNPPATTLLVPSFPDISALQEEWEGC